MKWGVKMIDRMRYYEIVMTEYLRNAMYLDYKNGQWLEPRHTCGTMCNISWCMLYEMGV